MASGWALASVCKAAHSVQTLAAARCHDFCGLCTAPPGSGQPLLNINAGGNAFTDSAGAAAHPRAVPHWHVASSTA